MADLGYVFSKLGNGYCQTSDGKNVNEIEIKDQNDLECATVCRDSDYCRGFVVSIRNIL